MNIFNHLQENETIPSYTIDSSETIFLGGSVGAYMWEDEDGNKWVIKYGKNIEQLYNEFVSNKVYDKFDIEVPFSKLAIINGELAMVSEYLEDSLPLLTAVQKNLVDMDETFKGFLVDVITANWDVVGSNYNLDNIRYKDGTLYRVDLGGTFDTRAQGMSKAYDGSSIKEIDSLIEFNQRVFGELTQQDMKESFREIFRDYIVSDAKIDTTALKSDLFNVIMENTKSSSIESFQKAEKLSRILTEKIVLLQELFAQ
jgi:hypothetical protein